MRRLLYTLAFLIGATSYVNAQNGSIQGKVTDENGAGVAFANVMIVDDPDGTKLTSKGAKTDKNGLYTIVGVQPGSYYVMVRYIGKPKIVDQVIVYANTPSTLNYRFERQKAVKVGGDDKKVIVTATKLKKNEPPIFDKNRPVQTVITGEQIKEQSTRDLNNIVAQTSGVVQDKAGGGVNMGGGRDDANVTFIDGVKVTGQVSVPPSMISQMEVITSGVPAKYGDLTGGVVNITTRGPSNKFQGGIEGITSKYLDPFGYNLVSGNISGPIIRRKSTYDTSEDKKVTKIPGEAILGFVFGGEYQSDYDRSPSYLGGYKIKDDSFKAIQSNPYFKDNTGKITLTQNLLNANSFEHIDAHQNASGKILRLNGKLDLKLSKQGMNFTMGGRYVQNNYNDYIIRYSLLNFANNREVNQRTYGGFVRLFVPLFDANKQQEKDKLFRNTTLTLQADYENTGSEFYSSINKFDLWTYGYIGRMQDQATYNSSLKQNFNVYSAPGVYNSFSNAVVVETFGSSGVNFTPSQINPLTSDLTSKFIGISGSKSINEITSAGGLINGSRASDLLHDLYYPYGRVYPSVQKQKNEQYRVSGNMSFDIVNRKSKDLNKHTIEMGFELEQRINRQFNIVPASLWTTARSSVNAHLSNSNTVSYNPLLIMQNGTVRMRYQDYLKQVNDSTGIKFYNTDTIVYDTYGSNGSAQTTFSKNLRRSLGMDSLTYVLIDTIAPSKFALNMFSADEVINSGFAPSYYGYNYYGELSPTNVKFNDFFTKKDNNGNFMREVAPFMPIYGAGYIQDRFQLKDISFNVGLRAEYFNANQYVLKDPYVINGAKTINEVDKSLNPLGAHPSILPNDAVVYVNSIDNPSTITGYRVGSQWYSSAGLALAGPDLVKAASGGSIKPYLQGNSAAEKALRTIGSNTFDPNLVFTPTTANINILPRLNFSFQIDTFAMFFAHFDMMSQRPNQDLANTSASDYYDVFGRKTGTFINNPNLKTPRSTDLEFGFKQRISPKSSVTITFFYREYIDQIQYAKINGAYPFDYYTWANTDYSTVKGIGLSYELRRNKNIRFSANYKMQFAEGTGSSQTSQKALIDAGQGNVKTIFPLNFDVRHNLNTEFDWRFGYGDRYQGPAKWEKILERFGINIFGNLRSGTPFTAQSNAVATSKLSSTDRAVTLGDINASHKPWRYTFNVKIDKSFTMKVGKYDSKAKTALDARKEVFFNVYVQIRNLLNTQNVIDVYRYTGSSTEDGYLASANGIVEYTSKEASYAGQGKAFRDLYKIALQQPSGGDFFDLPRTIQLGASLNF